jgi:polar amino acid transport system substrate-binding protein
MRQMTLVAASFAAAAAIVMVGAAGAARHATTFTFCTDPTFPPMELASSSGAISGFDVDMAAAVAKTFGATAKPLKTAFPGLIPALNAKKCDAVISGIFVTPDRLKQAGAVAYMETHRVFIVRAGNPKHVTGANASLKGLNVVVQAGTKYEEFLKSV